MAMITVVIMQSLMMYADGRNSKMLLLLKPMLQQLLGVRGGGDSGCGGGKLWGGKCEYGKKREINLRRYLVSKRCDDVQRYQQTRPGKACRDRKTGTSRGILRETETVREKK